MNLIFNGLSYSIPTSWQEITVEQFQKMDLIPKDLKEIDLTLNIVSCVSGINVEDLEDLAYTEYNKLKKVLEYLKTDIKREVKYTFELDGITYGLSYDPAKMSTREYLDGNELIKDKDLIVSNLHRLMAVLYRPGIGPVGDKKLDFKIEKYHTSDLEERSKIFLNAPIEIAMAVFFCFGIWSIALFQHMGDSSTNKTQEVKPKKQRKKTVKKK